jgi:hypothetical protein
MEPAVQMGERDGLRISRHIGRRIADLFQRALFPE